MTTKQFQPISLIWLILLLPLTAIASQSGPEISTPYIEKVEAADKACADGKWEAAEHYLTQALEADPDNPSNPLLLSNLGMIRFNLGKDSLAVVTLSEAHEMAPVSVTILSNRAKVLAAIGEDEWAYEDYGKIIELDTTYISARLQHGLLAMRMRDFNTAKRDFQYLETYFPETDETNIAMATFKSLLGEYAEAIPYYNRILVTTKEPEYYGARAYCFLMTDKLQEASDDIAAALELAPDDGELYLYRAALNKMRFRPADASADARHAIDLGVDPARARPFITN
ncbi:MAG: tetratricopeptide repeat protein [Duncaniella sp.]|nr:tetratricopeptide repeat protein [Duncaniella sp.]